MSMSKPNGATDASPHELTSTNAPAFLEEFERSGSVRLAARALAVDRQTCYEFRYQDAEFRNAWDVIRLRHTGDELMVALDGLVKLGHWWCRRYDWKGAVAELVNVLYVGREPPSRHGINTEALAAARERLDAAGKAWAAAVTAATTTSQIDGRRRAGAVAEPTTISERVA